MEFKNIHIQQLEDFRTRFLDLLPEEVGIYAIREKWKKT